jgi:hypothetical protein
MKPPGKSPSNPRIASKASARTEMDRTRPGNTSHPIFTGEHGQQTTANMLIQPATNGYKWEFKHAYSRL